MDYLNLKYMISKDKNLTGKQKTEYKRTLKQLNNIFRNKECKDLTDRFDESNFRDSVGMILHSPYPEFFKTSIIQHLMEFDDKYNTFQQTMRWMCGKQLEMD